MTAEIPTAFEHIEKTRVERERNVAFEVVAVRQNIAHSINNAKESLVIEIKLPYMKPETRKIINDELRSRGWQTNWSLGSGRSGETLTIRPSEDTQSRSNIPPV